MDTITELAAYSLKMAARLPGGPLNASARVIPFSKSGSNRYFFRLSDGNRSAVALIDPRPDGEFEDYISIGKFLWRNGIGVPEFYSVDRERGIVVMEDLGDLSLEITVKKDNTDKIMPLYKRCLDLLCELQTDITSAIKEENMLSGKLFDKNRLLSETSYFEDEFLTRFQSYRIPKGWKNEKEKLAEIISSQPLVFMHRDFQSRNIIIEKNKPRIIDFQTAHLGPGMYDTVSLLKDPYVSLSEHDRRSLLAYLYNILEERGAHNRMSYEEFISLFVTTGIQRNLQTLAAFAKLGYSDGKKLFLESIPAGLRLLEEGAGVNNSYPAIEEMAKDLLTIVESENTPPSG
ncbi:MAG: phosphotransferase [Candidatus Krumholzibacteriota bacterium]|nr:phosphotransferase [Candidatus Krumholzibacteriota bacterium]